MKCYHKSTVAKDPRIKWGEKMIYSKEFKQQAIKLSDEIGTKKACEQLGLTYFTLGDWRKKRKSETNNDSKSGRITSKYLQRKIWSTIFGSLKN